MKNKNIKKNASLAKHLIISLFIIFLLSSITLTAKNIQAFLSYATFSSPDNGPYIETYLSVVGNSVVFKKNANDKYQGTIEISMIFRQGEKIINFDKYELLSPEIDDTTDINFNFIDQQRISLSNGSYEFEIRIADLNTEAKPFITLEPVLIDYPPDKVTVSGIELIESYKKTLNPSILSKSGYDFIPYVYNYYPEKVNKLTFYSEIYNTEKVLGNAQKFLVSFYIGTIGTNKPLTGYVKSKKEDTKTVKFLFNEFDISKLPSGNYNLVIEVRDRGNNLIGLNKLFFQRSNPNVKLNLEDIISINLESSFAARITSKDTLLDYIYSLTPISSEQEKVFVFNQLKLADLKMMQKYFYSFWLKRNELNPEQAWLNYLGEVNKVNFAYSTQIRKGYDTDRGRVYLKYGPPNSISESYNEPATYPYEIWHYYVLLNSQRNKKFVFYAKDIVTNDFFLIHSDAVGELSNYRWQQILYGRVDPGFNIDDGVQEDPWGGKSKDYFDNPR
ncbi:MAG: GWxTD domain-containing protein [Bacteroidales bacterium]|nr:GWxTD domain-containing protein [Bacteroidales bacterium]